jgi:cyclin D6, plant
LQWQFGGEIAVHPRIAYLALNYVDRFLTKRVLPVRTRAMGLS